MDYTKLAAVVGTSVIGIIVVIRLDPKALKDVSIHAIDAVKEVAMAYNSHRNGKPFVYGT